MADYSRGLVPAPHTLLDCMEVSCGLNWFHIQSYDPAPSRPGAKSCGVLISEVLELNGVHFRTETNDAILSSMAFPRLHLSHGTRQDQTLDHLDLLHDVVSSFSLIKS